MKRTVTRIVLFLGVLAFCIATGQLLFMVSPWGERPIQTTTDRSAHRPRNKQILAVSYKRLLEAVSPADNSASQSVKNVSIPGVSYSTKNVSQAAISVSAHSVSQVANSGSIQSVSQASKSVSTHSDSQVANSGSIQSVSTQGVSQLAKSVSTHSDSQVANNGSIQSVSTQGVSQLAKNISAQSDSQSTKNVSSVDKTADRPKDKRPSTLSYSQWMKDFPCLAKIASSRTYFTSMKSSAFLCCLKSIRDSIPLGLSLQDQSTLQSAKFSKWFIETLPVRDIPRFGSCAVVASASSLKKYRYGKEIDSHDAVFRFNNAPTAGYEHLVGRRTTVRVINSQLPYHYKSNQHSAFSSMLEHPDKDLIIFERDEIPSAAVGENPAKATAVINSSVTNSSLLWDKSKWNPISKYMTLRHKFPNVPYYLTHPVFTFFSQWRLLGYYSGGGFHEASSGFVGVLLATFICDSVTSYEVATNDPFSSREAYYYGFAFDYSRSWHPLRIERAVLLRMARCRPGTTTCTISIADAVC